MAIPDRRYSVNQDRVIGGDVYVSSIAAPMCSGTPIASPTRYREWAFTSMKRQRPKPVKLLPTNATYQEFQQYPDDTRSCTNQPGGGVVWGSGGHSAYHYGERFVHTNFSPSALEQEAALLTAFSRLNRTSSSFGESFAELSQTGGMIARRINQVANIALSLKQRDWKRLGEALKGEVPGSVKKTRAGRQLAEGWLELEFGWKPLLEDVHTIVAQYRDRLVEGQLANSRGNSVAGGFGPRTQGNKENASRILNGGGNSSSKLYATVGNATLATMNELGLVNPASLAWDLLPFSFVVDWLIPIGPAISSLTSKVGYKVEAECRVTEDGHVAIFDCGELFSYVRNVNRTVIYNPNVPSVPFRMNYRANSIWHVWTSIALLRTVFGR